MEVYTQEEFDAIKRDKYGVKNCPTGDYTQIKSFPEYCSFGEWCSFGERCSFGEKCSFEAARVINGTYFACDRIGSEKRKTYFSRVITGALYVQDVSLVLLMSLPQKSKKGTAGQSLNANISRR